jgi:hypothetical protein
VLTGKDENERISDTTAITTIKHTLQHIHWASPDIILFLYYFELIYFLKIY